MTMSASPPSSGSLSPPPESTAPGSFEHRTRRALYRATHRGTKELDWLIGRFAESVLPQMSSVAMDHFEQFLTLPDPDLHTWIMNPERIENSAFRELIHTLRAFHKMTD